MSHGNVEKYSSIPEGDECKWYGMVNPHVNRTVWDRENQQQKPRQPSSFPSHQPVKYLDS